MKTLALMLIGGVLLGQTASVLARELPPLLAAAEPLEEVTVTAPAPVWRKPETPPPPSWREIGLPLMKTPSRLQWLPPARYVEAEHYDQVRDRQGQEPLLQLFRFTF